MRITDDRRYQKNTGRRRCILLLVLIIFGLIIVLIYKPRGRSKPLSEGIPSPSPSGRPKHHIVRPPSHPNGGVLPADNHFRSRVALENDIEELD